MLMDWRTYISTDQATSRDKGYITSVRIIVPTGLNGLAAGVSSDDILRLFRSFPTISERLGQDEQAMSQTSSRHYPNAPITEAVLDLRVYPRADVKVDDLAS